MIASVASGSHLMEAASCFYALFSLYTCAIALTGF
jgi:hypothetical protein